MVVWIRLLSIQAHQDHDQDEWEMLRDRCADGRTKRWKMGDGELEMSRNVSPSPGALRRLQAVDTASEMSEMGKRGHGTAVDENRGMGRQAGL